MQDFRNLKVWEKSHNLVLDVYTITKSYPLDEKFGLTNQMRRASMSIPTNIAEGCGRGSDIDFARFVQIAMGSACELEYLFILSSDLKYVEVNISKELSNNIREIKRMLVSLIKKLRSNR